MALTIQLSGDIHPLPGPNTNTSTMSRIPARITSNHRKTNKPTPRHRVESNCIKIDTIDTQAMNGETTQQFKHGGQHKRLKIAHLNAESLKNRTPADPPITPSPASRAICCRNTLKPCHLTKTSYYLVTWTVTCYRIIQKARLCVHSAPLRMNTTDKRSNKGNKVILKPYRRHPGLKTRPREIEWCHGFNHERSLFSVRSPEPEGSQASCYKHNN